MAFTITDNITAKRVIRSLNFIEKLDQTFDDPRKVGAIELIDIFGRDGLRRFSTGYTIMKRQGIIPTYRDEELDDLAERVIQRQLINQIGDLWCRPLIDRYYAYLLELNVRWERSRRGKQRKVFVFKTVTAYIRAAKTLLLWLPEELHDIRGLDQETFMLNCIEI